MCSLFSLRQSGLYLGIHFRAKLTNLAEQVNDLQDVHVHPASTDQSCRKQEHSRVEESLRGHLTHRLGVKMSDQSVAGQGRDDGKQQDAEQGEYRDGDVDVCGYELMDCKYGLHRDGIVIGVVTECYNKNCC